MAVSSEIWLPVASALGGALIGSIAPVVVGWIQTRAEARRERLRLAVQLGIEDHKHLFGRAEALSTTHKRRVGVPPLSAIVQYHMSVLLILSKHEALKPNDFVELRNQSKAVFKALSDLERDEGRES
jgi:hypothetical protein